MSQRQRNLFRREVATSKLCGISCTYEVPRTIGCEVARTWRTANSWLPQGVRVYDVNRWRHITWQVGE